MGKWGKCRHPGVAGAELSVKPSAQPLQRALRTRADGVHRNFQARGDRLGFGAFPIAEQQDLPFAFRQCVQLFDDAASRFFGFSDFCGGGRGQRPVRSYFRSWSRRRLAARHRIAALLRVALVSHALGFFSG